MGANVGDLLQRRKATIVEKVIGSVEAPIGPARRELLEDLLAETTRVVDCLLAALQMGRPALFFEYSLWVMTTLAFHRASGARFVALLEAIRAEVLSVEGTGCPSAAELISEAILRARHESLEMPSTRALGGGHAAELSAKYLDLLLDGKRQSAAALIMGAVDEGLPLETLYLDVLEPALKEVGRLWQRNEVSVAQEHYVSAATQLIVSQLYPRLLAGPRNGKVLVAGCVGSNLHEIGLRFLSDIFELRGWDAHFVGASTPKHDLLQLIRAQKPDIVAIGVTLASQLVPAADFIALLRSDEQVGNIPVLAGGAAFAGHQDLWQEIGADGYAPNPSQALSVADRLSERSV